MLFIIGLDRVIRALCPALPPETGKVLWLQMGHVAWEGLAVYDLIFPLFVFISGVAMRCSLARAQERGVPRLHLLVKLWVRALVLVALGVLVNFEIKWGVAGLRYASVLGLIGLACALTGSIALPVKRWWARALVAAVLLGGVGALQYWGGDYSPTSCVNAAIDALLCPGRLALGVVDPEGPLCVVSATALCMAGMLAGALLTAGKGIARADRLRRGGALVLLSAGLLAAGLCCGPIIKNIWTPAFVLVSAGVGSCLLGVFHILFDGPRGGRYSWPLRVVGVNALFIYLLTHIGRFDLLVEALFFWVPQSDTPMGRALCFMLPAWGICAWMWRRGIVVKV